MIRFFWMLLSLTFPWLVLLLNDNPGGAIICLIMQATLVGWIPATLWAMRVVNENHKETKKKKKTSEEE